MKSRILGSLGIVLIAMLLVVFQNCGKMISKSNLESNEASSSTESFSIAQILMYAQEVPATLTFGVNESDSTKLDYQLNLKTMEVYLNGDSAKAVVYNLNSVQAKNISAALSNSVVKQFSNLNGIACTNATVYAGLETNLENYSLGDGPSCSFNIDLYRGSGGAPSKVGLKKLLSDLADEIDAAVPSTPTQLREPTIGLQPQPPVLGLPDEPVKPPVVGLPVEPVTPPVVGLMPPTDDPDSPAPVGLPPPTVEPGGKTGPIIGLPPPLPPSDPNPPLIIGLPPPTDQPVVQPPPVVIGVPVEPLPVVDPIPIPIQLPPAPEGDQPVENPPENPPEIGFPAPTKFNNRIIGLPPEPAP